MGSIGLIIDQLLFSYFLSVAIAWFIVHFMGEKSGVRRSLRMEVIFFPVFLAALYGLLPGTIFAAIMSKVFDVAGPISNLSVMAGSIVSGVILHRKLRSTVSQKRQSDLLIAAVFAIYSVSAVLTVTSMNV